MPDQLGWLPDLWRALGEAAASVVIGAGVGFAIAAGACGLGWLAHWLVTRGR